MSNPSALSIVVRLQHSFPMRITEWVVAGILTTWGVVLSQPGDVLINEQYEMLTRVANESTWAAICLLVGTTRLLALFINGAWRPSPHIRAAMAGLSTIFWLYVVLGIFAVGELSTGMAVYPWLLLADFYAVFRASRDARLSDDRAREKRESVQALSAK